MTLTKLVDDNGAGTVLSLLREECAKRGYDPRFVAKIDEALQEYDEVYGG